jgi:dienelactone hydrolase
MHRTSTAALLVFSALAACSPGGEASRTETAIAPDVAAAAAAGAADPRIPTVDPATITDRSSVADVMHAYVIPGSETLFAAESEPPAKAEDWAKLRTAAQDVITGAELLKSPERAQGRDGWIKSADTVIAATKQTAKALSGNNAEDLVFTDGDMMAGCTDCHQKFRDMKVPEGHLVGDKPT